MHDHQSLDAWHEAMAHRERSAEEPDSPESVEPIDFSDQRNAPRFTLLIRVAKLTSPGAEFLCVVRDASETGISVRLFHPLPAGLDFTLELPNGDRHALERVWETEGKAGFRFREVVALERIVEARGGYAKRPMRLQFELPCRLVLGERRCRRGSPTCRSKARRSAPMSTFCRLSASSSRSMECPRSPPASVGGATIAAA